MINVQKECTDKEVKLMKNAGVYLEDKDYSSEELKKNRTQYNRIYNDHSSKNGDIARLQSDYDRVFRLIQK